jgi:hypothetical protein
MTSAAIAIISEFSTQGLNNTVWAFATRSLLHMPLLSALSEEAIRLIAEYRPQEHANTAWSVAKLAWMHPPLLTAIASASLRTIDDFESQNLANLVWSFATLSIVVPRELEQPNFLAPDMASPVWALEELMDHDQGQLLNAIASAAVRKLGDFGAQDLSNTAWAFSTRLYLDVPLMHALAGAAVPTISQYEVQDLANTVWSFALRSVPDSEPLLEAIAGESITKIG